MSKEISTLTPGSFVKLNENGVPRIFIFMEYNHYGMDEVTLLKKDTFGPTPYAYGFQDSYTNDTASGNNVYFGSNLDMFCNVLFPMTLDPIIQACLVNVPIPVRDGSFSATNVLALSNVIIHRKGFALSAYEMLGDKLSATNDVIEGTIFANFSSDTSQLISHLDYNNTYTTTYWCRTPYSRKVTGGYLSCAYIIQANGAATSTYTFNSGQWVNNGGGTGSYKKTSNSVCPRPAITLSSKILVSDEPDEDNCYNIEDAVVAGENYIKVNGAWRKMC